jgi:hypothetical protein
MATIWTDERIERRCERMMDHLDRVLLAGAMSQGDYDKAVLELDEWANARYRTLRAWRRAADAIDGYDRDNLGESPDF